MNPPVGGSADSFPARPPALARLGLGCALILVLLVLLFQSGWVDLPTSWGFGVGGLSSAPFAAFVVAALILMPFVLRRAEGVPWMSARPPAAAPSGFWVLFALLAVLFVVLGDRWPAKPICLDAVEFSAAAQGGVFSNARWGLALRMFHAAFDLLSPLIPPSSVVPTLNALLSAAAFAAISCTASSLTRSRFEWILATGLSWSAFGNLQLVFGYIDIYPLLQFFVALILWTSVRAASGKGWVGWPLALMAVAPFAHPGIILLAPSVAVASGVVLLDPDRRLGAILGFVFALFAAGMATIPSFGVPFAFSAWLSAVSASSLSTLGLSPSSSLLPPDYLLSGRHLLDLVNGMALVDAVGIISCLTAGLVLLWCSRSVVRYPQAWILAAPAFGGILFSAVMDPLWGPFLDWDLFSYTAVSTSLFGAVSFLWISREQPNLRAMVATAFIVFSFVHLEARLNRLHENWQTYLQQSPVHLEGVDLLPPAGVPVNREENVKKARKLMRLLRGE